MATVTIRVAKKSLSDKGFLLDKEQEHEESHWYYRLYVGGEPTDIETHISRRNSGSDLRQIEITGMKTQMAFSSARDLLDFLRCTMPQDRYLEILTEKGIL